ncbi:MAG: hypothetical protein E5Y67_16375 [Mesorhizobium sp.]|uniref:hypothetical protein n=1 Tax=Mesorhizobium sp. TaxID=1871066 RepID=UPI0011FC55A0|nr:hypothetical protein [Mesorhizobium sp.]TIM13664.1 MAG: hypothetical protein E5Y67_16375 [Mesorhizobium sp.]
MQQARHLAALLDNGDILGALTSGRGEPVLGLCCQNIKLALVGKRCSELRWLRVWDCHQFSVRH